MRKFGVSGGKNGGAQRGRVVIYSHHYSHQNARKPSKINIATLTTNQKVVGSNPAGLTKTRTPEAKQIKASGVFVRCNIRNANRNKLDRIRFYSHHYSHH